MDLDNTTRSSVIFHYIFCHHFSFFSSTSSALLFSSSSLSLGALFSNLMASSSSNPQSFPSSNSIHPHFSAKDCI
ncbi:hypothetical protein L6452_16639 [Arctium lappa]|uniref:Uncharacterized protein n=1 Tax=Arctium lappa TaxID=4217 RepID=A0ACB9C125_ARCLA|nr:hypothetical protein L6452_16639 [Arctium lappa]